MISSISNGLFKAAGTPNPCCGFAARSAVQGTNLAAIITSHRFEGQTFRVRRGNLAQLRFPFHHPLFPLLHSSTPLLHRDLILPQRLRRELNRHLRRFSELGEFNSNSCSSPGAYTAIPGVDLTVMAALPLMGMCQTWRVFWRQRWLYSDDPYRFHLS